MLQTLTDTQPLRWRLEESADGKLIVRGEFANANKKTANGRRYPENLWVENISRLRREMQERKLLGELDHPSDGKVKLARVSHIITEMAIKDGVVEGAAEILDTPNGQILKSLFKSNVPVGVSSRGSGSVVRNDQNEDVVQNDFQLVTFDFVADPANSTSYPEVQAEDRQMAKKAAAKVIAENSETDNPAVAAAAEPVATPPAQAPVSQPGVPPSTSTQPTGVGAPHSDQPNAPKAPDPVPNPKTDPKNPPVQPPARDKSPEKDPAIDPSHPVLNPEKNETQQTEESTEQMRKYQKNAEEIARLRTENQSLKEDNERLARQTQELGVRIFVERNLQGYPGLDEFLKKLDYQRIESLDQIRPAVTEIAEDLQEQRKQEAFKMNMKSEQLGKELSEAKAALSHLTAEVKTLKEQSGREVSEAKKTSEDLERKLKESREEARELQARLTFEARIAGNPAAPALRKIFESSKDKSEKAMTTLIESFDGKRSAVFKEIRESMDRRKEADLPKDLVEQNIKATEAKRPALNESFEIAPGVNADMNEMKRLSNIRR